MKLLNNYLLNDYPEKTYLGLNQDDEPVYMDRPSWDCDWYWGFGYIGNKNFHTHLNHLGSSHLYNNIKEYFKEFVLFDNDEDLWVFCEIVNNIYILRNTAELFYTGSSNMIYRPNLVDMIKNKSIAHDINSRLIPQLIDELYKVLQYESI